MKQTIKGTIRVRPTSIPVIMQYDPDESLKTVADKWTEFCRGVVANNVPELFECVEVRFE